MSYQLSRRHVLALVGAGILVVSGVGITVLCISYRRYEQAGQTLAQLKGEFGLIKPLPEASELQCNSMHKISQGHVSCEYQTHLNYDVIRDYYDRELRTHGWNLARQKDVLIWGESYGGKEIIYCKGAFDATIQYAGQEPDVLWTYGVTLSWGISDDCH